MELPICSLRLLAILRGWRSKPCCQRVRIRATGLIWLPESIDRNRSNSSQPSRSIKYSAKYVAGCTPSNIKKRGVPHSHNLFWLKEKIPTSQSDQIISAEIPDKQLDAPRDPHDLVLENMVHGPCGTSNPSCPCVKDNKCSKRYPRQLLRETQTGDDGYPTYRRRSTQDGGFTATLSRGNVNVEIDNRWIVPYCPLLSKMFKAHINVEFCNSVRSIKCVCKYVTKGSDIAMFGISAPHAND